MFRLCPFPFVLAILLLTGCAGGTTAATGETPAAWVDLGQFRLAGGNTAGAQEAFQRALALQPGNLAAIYGLGLSELRAGAMTHAAALLAQAAPRIATRQAYTRWGYAAMMAGDSSNAVDAFRRALRLADNDPDAQSNLALALALAGDRDEAGALAQRLAQSPLARDSHRRDVVLVLALIGQDDRIAQLLPTMHADQVQALVLSAQAIHALKTPAEQARSLGELAASAR